MIKILTINVKIFTSAKGNKFMFLKRKNKMEINW